MALGAISRLSAAGLLLLVPLLGCGGPAEPAPKAQEAAAAPAAITLYTCVSDPAAKAVIERFQQQHKGAKVDLFRAPTGQLNARVAADRRSGGVRADVIWACDPMTMHGYSELDVLDPWVPKNAAQIPAKYRTPEFTGVDLLYLVVIVHQGAPLPADWADLTKPAYRGAVAVPDPGFAASALGLLGYLDSAPGYGLDFYRDLKANGAVQVNSPDEVLTGVAQGTYKAGIGLANAAYAAKQKGSPIEVVWPRPGAVAVYAPIAVTTHAAGDAARSKTARDFATFVAGQEGQTLVARNNVYPILEGIPGGPTIPPGAPIVTPDWPTLFGDNAGLLQQYRAIFPS